MPIQKSEAILLRHQDLRETSLILTFYARSFGKIRGVVKGARGSRGQFGQGAFEIFSKDEIVFYERKAGGVFTISQCELMDYFYLIRQSLDKMAYALYIVELLDSVTTDTNEDSAYVYDLLSDSLKLLATDISVKRAARIFEIKLLDALGLMPNLNFCAVCGGQPEAYSKFSIAQGGVVCAGCCVNNSVLSILPGTLKFIDYIRNSPFEKASKIKVAAPVGRELEAILSKYLDYHLERRLRSLRFIKEIDNIVK